MDNDKLAKFAARQQAKFEEKGLVESPSKNRTPRDAMEAALLWARRKGYPLPDKPWPRWILLIGILGLFAALLPGLAVIGIWPCSYADRFHDTIHPHDLLRGEGKVLPVL